MSARVKALSIVLLLMSAVEAHSGDWDGLYIGVNVGYAPMRLSTDYNHQRLTACTNLNFGSGWPGDGCEGNQDYATESAGKDSGRSVSLSIERLWTAKEGMLGIQANLAHAGGQTVGFSQTISDYWGDRLDVDVRAGMSVDARLVYGVPVGDWMPFLSVGLGLLQLRTTYTQAHGGNVAYPSVTRTGDTWAGRGIVGGGIKKDIGNDWILSADVAVMRTTGSRFGHSGVLLDGGLRYPNTTIDTDTTSTEIRFGLSRRF